MLGRSRHRSDLNDDIPLVNPAEFVYKTPSNLSIAEESPQPYYHGKRQHVGTHQNEAAVAIKKSRNISPLQWLTHGSSVLITIALILLCARNVYFADLTRPNLNSILNAFQFIARMHEIIVTASFTMMVVYQLRYELVAASGVPLGLLTNAYALTQPQALFTKEFWKATMSRSNVKRKYWFSILIVVSTVLIALTGPSSAIVMIPQLDWWDLKRPFSDTDGYSWLNNTYTDRWVSKVNLSMIYPSCIPNSVLVPYWCPFANTNGLSQWASDQLSQWAVPNITVQSQVGMLRYLTASNTSVWSAQSGTTVASTAMDDLTRNMGTIWLYAIRNDLEMSKPGRPMISLQSIDPSKPILRPFVQVQCGPVVDITNQDSLEITFPADQLVDKTGNPAVINNVKRMVDVQDYQSPDYDNVRFNYTDLSAEAGRPFIGALTGISFQNPQLIFGEPYNATMKARGLMACTMLAHWIPSAMSRDVKIDNLVTVDNPDPATIIANPTLMAQARDLEIGIGWAQATTPMYEEGNITTMETQLENFAFAPPFYDGGWRDRWPWLVSSMISMSITDALSRIDNVDYTYIWKHNSTHPASSLAIPLDDLNLNSIQMHNLTNGSIAEYIEALPDLFHPVQWKVTRYGYAWAYDRTPKYLATLVIVLHTTFVLVHLVVVFVRQWRCDSWDTLTKLVVLAIQSPPSTNLVGAASRISDSSTYTDIVRVQQSRNTRREEGLAGLSGHVGVDNGDGQESVILTVSGHHQQAGQAQYAAISDTPSSSQMGYTNTYDADHQGTKLVFGKKYL